MSTREASTTLPDVVSSAASARRFATSTLESWSCLAVSEAVVLLVGELVTNAVLHGQPPIRLSMRLTGGRLRVEVADGNPRLPALRHYSATAATGRGLLLVDRVAARWGATELVGEHGGGGGGKVVWFELDATRPWPLEAGEQPALRNS